MSGNLLIGSGVMAVCVIIQCVAVAVLLRFFRRHTDQQQFGLTTSALISLVQSLSQRFKQAAERKLDSKSG